MNLFSVSSVLIVVSSALMAILLFGKGFKNKQSFIWAWYSLGVAIWGIGAYNISFAKDYHLSFFWWRFAYAGLIPLPALFLHFTCRFLQIKRKFLINSTYFLCFVFFVLNLVSKKIFLGEIGFLFNQFYWTTSPGPMLNVFTFLFIFGVIVYSHYELLRAFKATSNSIKKVQIKYFFIGSSLGWGGGFLCFLINYGLRLYPFGNFGIILYPIVYAYAILKHQLMDIRVAITRAGVALGVYSIIFSVPFFIGYLFNLWMVSTVVAIIIAIPAPLIYRYFRLKAEKLIFAQQRNYQKLLLQAGEEIAKEHDSNNIVQLINSNIQKAVNAEFIKTFVADEISNFSYDLVEKIKKTNL